MALIEYVEPINIFGGIATLLMTAVFAYIAYRLYGKLADWVDIIINREAKYEVVEEIYLDRFAEQKGINLDKELIKRKVIQDDKKNLRKRIQDEIYKDMFERRESKKDV